MENDRNIYRRMFDVAALTTVGVVVFLLVNILVFYLNLRWAIDSQREAAQSSDRLLAISELRRVVQNADSAQRDFLATGDQRFRNTFDVSLGKISQTRRRLKDLVASDPRLIDLDGRLDQQIDGHLTALKESLDHRNDPSVVRPSPSDAEAGMNDADFTDSSATDIENAETAHRIELQTLSETRIQSAIALIFLASIFGFGIVGVGFYLLQREIVARRDLAEALQRADRKKNEFLAVVGHELRNPLAAVSNAADVLNMLGTLDDTGEEMRSVINRQIAFMSRLVNDLLDTTRVAHGKLELRKGRIDLAELLRRTVADARSAMQGNDVTIDLEVPEDPVWVSGDATRLVQVVANLVDNAVKFSPRNGRVWVTLRAAGGDLPRATILVIDHGAGMDDETLQSVFEPFVQGRAGNDRGRRGLGLGLALARALVDLHGGEIVAQSDGPGHGTTVSISLPLDSAAPEECEVCSTEASHPGRCRVVIIDDRRDAAYTLRRILEFAGHEVHVASDGSQGIDLARAVRPDLVLCDIGLAGDLDGYDVAQELRRSPETSGAHLVAVTGYGQDEVRQRAIGAGFDRHLVKPASIAVLNQIVAELPCSTAAGQQPAGKA
jgi:signal transduction histidine kinase/ActR/RegA family two-component response regulator